MTKILEPQTKRLRLRQWKKDDRVPFAAISADPLVMEYFPAILNRFESNAIADRCQSLIAEQG
ncbi:GNAT family N-acetyltransferase [Veronia pacifica]|uniref:GNAT family N-acetyltransferase n=1 Tax=Veronia pacifica TaxID=1080227 RepID=UPI001C2FA8A7|nr:GNAT family N-acetyltransferase [Veronia pacifica]